MMEVRGKERCEKGKLSPTDRQLQGGGTGRESLRKGQRDRDREKGRDTEGGRIGERERDPD